MAFLDKTGLERLWLHISSKLGNKVDKIEGKVLSTNDYTTEEKEQLSALGTLVGDTAVSTQISDAVSTITADSIGALNADDYYGIIRKEGNIVSAESLEGLAIGAVSMIEATQAGTGDPSPENVRTIAGWDAVSVKRTGRNLLDASQWTDKTNSGITLTNNGNGSVTVTGTNTATSVVNISNTISLTLKPGTYTVSGGGSTAEGCYSVVTYRRAGAVSFAYGCKTFEIDAEQTVTCVIQVGVGATVDVTLWPMIEAGGSASAFEPYQVAELTAALPETVYGGHLDWDTGKLTITHRGMVLNGTEDWKMQNASIGQFYLYFDETQYAVKGWGMCSHYKYGNAYTNVEDKNVTTNRTALWLADNTYKSLSELKAYLAAQYAAGTPVVYVYELETPTETYQLTAQQLTAIDGINFVYSDCGDTCATFNYTPILDIVNNLATDAREQIAELSEEIEALKSGDETEVTTETPVDFSTAKVGYINKSGQYIDSGASGITFFSYTEPIFLKIGDRIDISVKGYNQGATVLSILAMVEDTGYTSLVDTTDGANVADYTYTADEDCNVVISYDTRKTYSATVFSTEIVNTAEKGAGHAHYVMRQDDAVYIKSRYSAEEDVVVEIALAGGNHLPNPKSIYTVLKSGKTMDDNLAPARYLLDRYTDWFSPHQVRAVNNADGDDTATVIFTGGNHMSNNSSSGGVATGDCTQFNVLCDGALIENGDTAYCNGLTINITNEICGYNTWKADGTGRRILKEQIRITIGLTAKMEVEIIHTALEDVERMRYYGLQCVNDAYTAGIQYLGGANRALNPIDAASDCGNRTCRDGRLLSNDGDVMLTHMDDVDLGSFAYAPANNASYFATTATKAYFALISNSGTAETVFAQAAGEQTCCRGWYDFIHVN